VKRWLLFFALASAHAAPPDASYRLAWEERFDDPDSYRENWSFRQPGWRNEGYLNTEEAVRVDFEAGHLAIATTFGSPPKAGMVSTQAKRRFGHGYFETRMTLPRHPGHHVAFWLKSDEYDRAGPPATHGAEIDVIEYLPLRPDVAHFNLHAFGYGAQHQSAGRSVPGVVCAGCTHEFGLDWRAEGYTFYVDGRPLWRTAQFATAVPAYLILSSHVSAWGGFPRFGRAPDEVRFHYVRYYERTLP
jgi:beta-glucanase (GH16 family)